MLWRLGLRRKHRPVGLQRQLSDPWYGYVTLCKKCTDDKRRDTPGRENNDHSINGLFEGSYDEDAAIEK